MVRAQKYLGFNDKWLIVLGLPAITIIVSLLLFGSLFSIHYLFVSFAYSLVYWIFIREFLIVYHKKYPDYIFNWRRLGFVLFWLVIIYFGVRTILGNGLQIIFPKAQDVIDDKFGMEMLTTGLLIFSMFFLYEGIYYFNRSRLIEIEKNKLERVTAEHKLNTLKNQVNPHFLFNSLNTLVTIIPEEPDLAIKFVQELSKTYRSILEVRDEKLISIATELKALDSYIYLLKTRFQEKIQVFNELEDQIKNQFILPLSLQILIENAVKHNITSKAKPLKITIYNDDKYVIVTNNLQKKDQNYGSTKLGLANIKSRYQLLANTNIEVRETTESFIVKLPIIRNIKNEDTDN